MLPGAVIILEFLYANKIIESLIYLTISIDVPYNDFRVQTSEIQSQVPSNAATSTGDQDDLSRNFLKIEKYFKLIFFCSGSNSLQNKIKHFWLKQWQTQIARP